MHLPRREDPRGGRRQVPIGIGIVLTAAALSLVLVSRMLANLDRVRVLKARDLG